MKVEKYLNYFNAVETEKGLIFEINGFQGSLVNQPKGLVKNVYFAAFLLDQTLEKHMIKDIRRIAKTSVVVDTFKKKNLIIFGVNLKNNDTKELITRATNLIASYGVRSQVGNIYGPNEADKIVDYDIQVANIVYKGLKIEINQADYELRKVAIQKEEKMSEGNLVKAITLALVGALVGALPALIILYAFNYMHFFLFAIIPLASIFFYKKAKGPNSIIAPIIVSSITVILIIALIINYYNAFAVNHETDLWTFIESYDLMSNFIIDIVFALGAALFSIIFSWRFLNLKPKQF